jgi:predicted RNA-binding protein with PUA-like domain
VTPAARRAGRRAWLVKSNPDSYSIHDLERDGRTAWDGVRNYQARNILRDGMRPGDPVLYYHSGVEPMAIVGRARVAGAARPDPSAFDRKDDHYDPDSDPEHPRWFLVDLAHVETFAVPLERARLQAERALAGMMLLQRGSRLSVQPVTRSEYDAVLRLAKRAAAGR